MTEEQRTLRAFFHKRKGRIQGYVVNETSDNVWIDIELTDDAGRHGLAGDTITFRRDFATEIEPKP